MLNYKKRIVGRIFLCLSASIFSCGSPSAPKGVDGDTILSKDEEKKRLLRVLYFGANFRGIGSSVENLEIGRLGSEFMKAKSKISPSGCASSIFQDTEIDVNKIADGKYIIVNNLREKAVIQKPRESGFITSLINCKPNFLMSTSERAYEEDLLGSFKKKDEDGNDYYFIPAGTILMRSEKDRGINSSKDFVSKCYSFVKSIYIKQAQQTRGGNSVKKLWRLYESLDSEGKDSIDDVLKNITPFFDTESKRMKPEKEVSALHV